MDILKLFCGGIFEKIQKMFTLNCIQRNFHVWYVTYSPLLKKSLFSIIIAIKLGEQLWILKFWLGKE